MNIRNQKPSPAHHAFRNDALALLRKHADHLQAEDMLALSAHMVGQIIAMQDQRTMTRQAALEIVMANMEQGNAEVIDNLFAKGGKA